MLDLVLAVDDPLQWHKENMERNGHHYSFMRLFGPETVVRLQRQSAGVYYNTLVVIENQVREGIHWQIKVTSLSCNLSY